MSESTSTSTSETEEIETRTQHYIDPLTGERKPIQVKSISHKFRKGKGGAISGAVPAAGPRRPSLRDAREVKSKTVITSEPTGGVTEQIAEGIVSEKPSK